MRGAVPIPVLLMAYGTAPSLAEDDVRAYLEHILGYYRGARPSAEAVRDLIARYTATGGSPLYAVTQRIARRVQALLDERAPGAYHVEWAMKHSPPYLEDRVRELSHEGRAAGKGVAVALAPFQSRLSTGGYYEIVRRAAPEDAGFRWSFAPSWHLDERFLAAWERRIREALATHAEPPVVIFTNHSLPARILDWQDPYPVQFAATASALAGRLGLARWSSAYQSAGGGNVPWLGPPLFDVIADWVERGHRAVLLAPIGFVMDHLEVLYDLDIEARRMAQELGISLRRTEMLNDDPDFCTMLADIVGKLGAEG